MKTNICDNKLKQKNINNYNINLQKKMATKHKEEVITWFIYTIKGTNYIGSTKDLVKRQQQHQTNCFNPNYRCYTYPVYKYIRKTSIEKIELNILEFANCLKHNALLMENKWMTFNDSITNGQNSQLAYRSKEARLEKSREYSKLNYAKNKDEINAKKQEKIQCPICLKEHSRDSKARHNKRNHFTNPPTETREEYLERKDKEKKENKARKKAYKKKSNAKRKYKPKQECEHCFKKFAYGTLNQHYKYCPFITSQ